METSMLNGMCRCCASEGVFKDVKTSYTWMGEEEVYADMLRECFDINLSSSEHGEDGGICEVCITQLRNASNFKKQVLTTEEQFKKLALNKLFKPNIVKVEVSADDANDSDDNLSAEEAYSGPEFDVPIKTEAEEPKPKKRAAAKASTSRAKKAKTDNGEPSTKRVTVANNKPKKKLTNIEAPLLKQPARLLKVAHLKKQRENMKQVILWSNATPIRRSENTGYMCSYCDDRYRETADLKSHTLQNHPDVDKANFMKVRTDSLILRLDITDLKCKICDQSLNTLEELMQHLRRDHDKLIHTDIKNQITPFKFVADTLQCGICMKTFIKFKLLSEHMNLHCRNYICTDCDIGFAYSSGLRNHIKKHGAGTFKCDHCSDIFDTSAKKNTHAKAVHSVVHNVPTPHKCGYCNETFSSYWYKEAHLEAKHGVKVPEAKCQACDKVYKSRQALRIHIKKDHLMERLHKCTVCNKSFYSITYLKEHTTKQHTGPQSHKRRARTKN